MWRDRAVEQIDFAIKGQQTSGVFHTNWNLQDRPASKAGEFCSWDWDHNGYKVDINVWMVRHILETWQRVKEKEGVDRQDWRKAAIAALDWVLSQQNPDGGFPQVVDIESGRKSASVVCGRTLVALPIIAKLAGDARCLRASAAMERFLRREVEGRFWYTGQHPDLPPGDFEQDSIYNVVEYWLDKHDRTGDKESLDHAVANAYYALLYWCPKQLSWVKNPTQGTQRTTALQPVFRLQLPQPQDPMPGSAVQKDGQSAVCTAQEPRDSAQLLRSSRGRPLQGLDYRGDCRSRRERGDGFDYRGHPYTSELVADLMLQLIDMGLVKKP